MVDRASITTFLQGYYKDSWLALPLLSSKKAMWCVGLSLGFPIGSNTKYQLFQWLQTQATMNAVNESITAWNQTNPLSPKVWSCLSYLPVALFFVPHPDLSKHKFVKYALTPTSLLQKHWNKITIAVQLVSNLALFAAGHRLRAGGALLSLSLNVLEQTNTLPHKVRICASVAQRCLFCVMLIDRISTSKGDLLPLVVNIALLSLVALQLKRTLNRLLYSNPKTERVTKAEDIRSEDLIVNPHFKAKENWDHFFGGTMGSEHFKANLAKVTEVANDDLHCSEMAALFMTLLDTKVPAETQSPKRMCQLLKNRVYESITNSSARSTMACWLISYRLDVLDNMKSGYLLELYEGPIEQQRERYEAMPVTVEKYQTLLAKVPGFECSEFGQADQVKKNTFELIKAGVLAQKARD